MNTPITPGRRFNFIEGNLLVPQDECFATNPFDGISDKVFRRRVMSLKPGEEFGDMVIVGNNEDDCVIFGRVDGYRPLLNPASILIALPVKNAVDIYGSHLNVLALNVKENGWYYIEMDKSNFIELMSKL